jgi:hypothetical protein
MCLLAFLLAWDLLRDELGRPPTPAEYQRRFVLPEQAVQRDRRAFQTAFPGHRPDEVLDALWVWHEARLKPRKRLPIPKG